MTARTISLHRWTAVLRRGDRVLLALAALFGLLAVIVPDQAIASARFTLEAFLWIAPFLLLSVGLAGWLKAAGADRIIGAAADRSPARMIVLAAAFGALSPFCSCGVVPLVAALLAAGVSLPAVMAFWIASPLMDPEMFVLMAVITDLPFALAKTAAALALGLFAGFATLAAERRGLLTNPLRPDVTSGCGGPRLGPVALRWAFWQEPARRAAFAQEARGVTLFLGKWLLLAFALESLMVAWLPGDAVTAHLGGQGWAAIPLAVLVGVPAYLNGFAAVPLVGGLMDLGMAPGAALAFLVAGGVTSLPAAMAVFALVRRPVFLWYLACALAGSLLVGYAYQAAVVLLS